MDFNNFNMKTILYREKLKISGKLYTNHRNSTVIAKKITSTNHLSLWNYPYRKMGNNIANGYQLNHLTQTYGVCTTAILLKYIITIFWSANTNDHPPEDTVSLGPLPPPPASDELKRRQRALANDMENLPLHLIVFWAAFLLQILSAGVDGSEYSVKALQSFFIIYTVSRILYTICYAFALQPWRTVFFALALTSVSSAGILLIYSAFKCDF